MIKSNYSKSNGFSFIELMIVLAIAATLMLIGGPSFSRMIEQQKTRSAASILQKDIKFARQEAISQQRIVTICASDDGVSCANADNQWNQGYIIYADANEDNIPQFIELLRVNMTNDGERADISTGSAPLQRSFSYDSDGRAVNGVASGSFVVSSGSSSISVTLNTIGNPRIILD